MYPMTESPSRDAIPAATASKPSTKRELPLVLVVDDFEDNRSMYAVYLTYSGYDVIEAADGAEAVELAGERLPDLVVMDLSLPIMDGWEATRRLKGDPRTSHIPIIALTGHALDGHSRDARNAGCNAFLAKPCLPETLVAKVQELMQKAAMTHSGKGDKGDGKGDETDSR
jgi:two-component system, cell cycle response regulator DivK